MMKMPKMRFAKWAKADSKFFKNVPKNEGRASVTGSDMVTTMVNGKKVTRSRTFSKQQKIIRKKGQKPKCFVKAKSSESKNGKVVKNKNDGKWVDCKTARRAWRAKRAKALKAWKAKMKKLIKKAKAARKAR